MVFHLFTETSIFLALPNNCYCQLTGVPLIHLQPRADRALNFKTASSSAYKLNNTNTVQIAMKRKHSANTDSTRPAKKHKLTNSEEGGSAGKFERAKSNAIQRKGSASGTSVTTSRGTKYLMEM